ncbi:hypothetical protein Hanom_Chr09g00768541 [Helianthus anomalus]
MNINERARPLFIFVHLTVRMKFHIRVRSLIKQMNANELPAERFTKCSLNVQFVCRATFMADKTWMIDSYLFTYQYFLY